MLGGILLKLDYKQLFSVAALFLKNPLYALPTFLATKKCLAIAQKEFGDRHNLDNPPNAFRHALWVNLIIRNCLKWKKNEEQAKKWAKTFTDWHEKFAPNKPLARTMDLHNNQVGIFYYEQTKNLKMEDLIKFLKQTAKEAKQITDVDDTKGFKKSLVYISK